MRSLDLPVFVKPAELGSSVGVAKASSERELEAAINNALSYGEKVIVEEFIDGREIEVAVLGGRASVAGEIVIQTDWYDYESKYNDETSQFVAPARLTPPQSSAVREMAERAYAALGCKGLARVDFFLEERGRGFVINEVNTMPGFTPISGFPNHVAGERHDLRRTLRRASEARSPRRIEPAASIRRQSALRYGSGSTA